ncbi:PrsW family intramembrane metalloprotease [Nocardia mexicana]|uniref:RsiW-degrading membrane proteinase PrsW (M82 family) n=1 Tax=Nocardia mexicana TaxID=279262 RepID=A0A370H002_9NOCA|nr:PrsW family intramembrane metalloprotease [Nocardia mexicana]RDI48254.1 RsiW-degrading membrane proteinase PrsW (M82 family) [Nocardia mexicana]
MSDRPSTQPGCMQPRSALFWVYCLVIAGGALGLLIQLLPIALLTWSGILVGLPFTLATLAVIAWVLLRLDLFRAHRPIRGWLTMGFVWGAAAGPGIAMYANDNNMRVIQNLAGDAFAMNWQAPISAAIVEEAVKGAGVLAVAWLSRPLLTRPMHGLLLGGFTGLGFQVVEDLTYEADAGLNSAQNDIGTAVMVGVLRLATGVTSHWMLTGLAGIGIVVALAATDWSLARRTAVFAGFYLLGAALHFGWDAPQPEDAGIGDMARRTLVYILVFVVVYAWVVRTEKRWFRRTVETVEAEGLAPRGELETLISHRSRRRARRAQQVPRRQASHRQRQLLDWVQTVGIRLGTPFTRSDGPATAPEPTL